MKAILQSLPLLIFLFAVLSCEDSHQPDPEEEIQASK
jgi:hypothetical protein